MDTTQPSFFASLATRTRRVWQQTWREGGVLHSVWSDVRHAPRAGWDMANWLKAILLLTGAAIALILVNAAFTTITHWISHLLLAAPTLDVGTDTSSGIWGVIDQPIRTYIASRSAGMAISGSTIYTLWQIAGLYGLAGFAGSTIGRLLWTAWGAASAAAIWVTVPDHQRTLSVAIAALAWGLASLFALRGLRLLPNIHIFNAAPTIKPELHVPRQKDLGLDDVADAVQRRPRPRP